VSALARFVAEWHDETPVGRLDGEIDLSNVDEMAGGLRGLLTNQMTALVVDLSPTTYLDSAGINLLYSLAEELRARQLALHLVLPAGSPVARTVSITALDRALPTHATLDAALAAVRAQPA
jgi:anti-sigma B factor antagonist